MTSREASVLANLNSPHKLFQKGLPGSKSETANYFVCFFVS